MRRSVRITVAGGFVLLFLLPMATVAPNRTLAIAALAVGVLAMAAFVLKAVQSEGEGDGSTWELIPRRQYEGRYVEMGGATRTEQERALEEIHDEAADREPQS